MYSVNGCRETLYQECNKWYGECENAAVVLIVLQELGSSLNIIQGNGKQADSVLIRLFLSQQHS